MSDHKIFIDELEHLKTKDMILLGGASPGIEPFLNLGNEDRRYVIVENVYENVYRGWDEPEDIPKSVRYELSKPRQKSWQMTPMERAAQGRKAKREAV